MICPKCKTEYEDEYTVCSDCGSTLVEKEQNQNDKRDSFDWLKGFGKISAERAITILFYLGIFPLFISAIAYERYIYLTNKYMKDIFIYQDGQKLFTQVEANNLPLGVLLGITSFVFGVLVWKILCELLIIIFRCFETYVKKRDENLN